MKEYILCSAIHFDDGIEREHLPKNIDTGIVVCGRRHHNCFMTVAYIENSTLSDPIPNFRNEATVQGFLTNTDRFVDREEAADIAYEAGQMNQEVGTLFSEHLW